MHACANVLGDQGTTMCPEREGREVIGGGDVAEWVSIALGGRHP